MMSRKLFVLCMFIIGLGVAIAAQDIVPRRPIQRPRRPSPPQRHLDDDSTIALTIGLSSGNIRLDWHSFPEVPNWAVLRSSSPLMTSAETLAVTTDSSWIDTQALLGSASLFYQVLHFFDSWIAFRVLPRFKPCDYIVGNPFSGLSVATSYSYSCRENRMGYLIALKRNSPSISLYNLFYHMTFSTRSAAVSQHSHSPG